jgi:hypothetical protein
MNINGEYLEHVNVYLLLKADLMPHRYKRTADTVSILVTFLHMLREDLNASHQYLDTTEALMCLLCVQKMMLFSFCRYAACCVVKN